VPTQQQDQPSAKNADATDTVPGATDALPVGWSFGITVREVLDLAVMDSATILAGEGGLDRLVERLNMMEVPDVLPWVRPAELLVTSGYPLRELSSRQVSRMVRELSRRGLAGLCIKLGRFVPELPASAVKAANAEGFPILAMPADLAFTDLMSAALGELLDRQEAALRASDEVDRLLLQILVEGGGHQEIASRLAQWLDAPVMIASADWRVLAASTEHPLEIGDEAKQPGRHPRREEPDMLLVDGPRAVASIRTGATVQGYLMADGGAQSLAPGQLLAIRRAAPVVALAFSRVNEIRAVEARFRGDFLRDLLTGIARAGEDAHGHAAMFGWDLGGDLVVGVAEPTKLGPREGVGPACGRLATELRRAITERWPGAAVHGYAAEVVLLLPAAAVGELDAAVRQAQAHLSGAERHFRVGLSRPSADVAGIALAYRQAGEALHALRHRARSATVVSFDDLGLARLLSVVAESGQGAEFVADVLAPLAADRNGEELMRTLEEFLDRNCNVAATARALHFHYNTVRNRVARIEELVGGFVDDAERRAELMAACRLRHLLPRGM
jgi:purine catabolism regulator